MMKTAETYTYDGPTAAKMDTAADIVFCIDATGSMGPCIESIKNGIDKFALSLQTKAEVNYILRLIAYRDLHDPSAKDDPPWVFTTFTPSTEEFRRHLSSIKAEGGGDYRGAESTLDALYYAIHSEWRPPEIKAHKTIILLTDDNTHLSLHPSTYRRMDNDIYRVIQDFQTLRHIMLFMVAPDYPAYRTIQQSMRAAVTVPDQSIYSHFVPPGDERYEGLKGVEWDALLQMLGETISQSSLDILLQDKIQGT
jgi:hypothetical protein